ncbi:MAG: TolB family protein [Aureispira sp.]
MKQIVTTLVLLSFFACGQTTKKPSPINLDHQPKTVEIFGQGIVSTSLYERDMAISPDGTTILYTLGDYQQKKRGLVGLQKSAEGWSEPELLEISGIYQDIEPFFSADGTHLFFASNRPIGIDSTTDYNIWSSKKTATGWEEPIALGPQINTPEDEFYPSLTKNGNLYFTATREEGRGKEDIFVSKLVDGVYQKAVPLDSTINTKNYEFNAYISPEENLIIFSSYGRADDLGHGDLYYSIKDEAGNWAQSVNMGNQINSEKLDYCPFIDYQKKCFYFTSERIKVVEQFKTAADLRAYANSIQNGMGDIYVVSFDQLGIQ